jgi:hypothetical protein
MSVTQRVLLNDNSYTGSAGHVTSKAQTAHDTAYARSFNEIREMLVGRDPNKLAAVVNGGLTQVQQRLGKILLDMQNSRKDIQRQSASQNYRAAYCEQETRATNNISQDSTPRIDSLSLQDNPYASRVR